MLQFHQPPNYLVFVHIIISLKHSLSLYFSPTNSPCWEKMTFISNIDLISPLLLICLKSDQITCFSPELYIKKQHPIQHLHAFRLSELSSKNTGIWSQPFKTKFVYFPQIYLVFKIHNFLSFA